MSSDKKIPSLLDKEATGGDIAEGGFTFQGGIAVAHIPQWLADEGFSSMIREALGDIEASFYVPLEGVKKEFLEVKDHQVAPAELWREIDRFRTLAEASPSTYRRFSLVALSFSPEVKTVINALNRVRRPGEFYKEDTAFSETSYADFEKVVEGAGKSKDDAKFLFNHVFLSDEYGAVATSGRAVFLDELGTRLPRYSHASRKMLGEVFSRLADLVQSRCNTPITRQELVQTIREIVQDGEQPDEEPVRIFTLCSSGDRAVGLRVDLSEYSGDGTRTFPPPERWNTHLIHELLKLRAWIQTERGSRRVRIAGRRRLSTAIALGYTFSAVSGFVVEVDYRGQIYRSDAFPDKDALVPLFGTS